MCRNCKKDKFSNRFFNKIYLNLFFNKLYRSFYIILLPPPIMLELILGIISIVILLIASWCDLKSREVPDWLSYSLLIAAIGIRTIFSFERGSNVLVSGFIGFLICAAVAFTFYYSHQWGGADAKLLMGLGAVIGISYPFSLQSLDLFIYLFAVLFLGAFYGLLWMIVMALKNKKIMLQKLREYLHSYRQIHFILLVISGFLIIASITFPLLWPIALLPLATLYLLIFVAAVEQVGFYKRIPADTVTEGDWLGEDIYVQGKKISIHKTITLQDLNLLKKLFGEKKLTTIVIKQGVPFVPSFLLGYLFLIIFRFSGLM